MRESSAQYYTQLRDGFSMLYGFDPVRIEGLDSWLETVDPDMEEFIGFTIKEGMQELHTVETGD